MLGFPWTSNTTSAIRSLKELKKAPARNHLGVLEHPYNSWLWELAEAKELEEMPEFYHSVFRCAASGARGGSGPAWCTTPQSCTRPCTSLSVMATPTFCPTRPGETLTGTSSLTPLRKPSTLEGCAQLMLLPWRMSLRTSSCHRTGCRLWCRSLSLRLSR